MAAEIALEKEESPIQKHFWVIFPSADVIEFSIGRFFWLVTERHSHHDWNFSFMTINNWIELCKMFSSSCRVLSSSNMCALLFFYGQRINYSSTRPRIFFFSGSRFDCRAAVDGYLSVIIGPHDNATADDEINVRQQTLWPLNFIRALAREHRQQRVYHLGAERLNKLAAKNCWKCRKKSSVSRMKYLHFGVCVQARCQMQIVVHFTHDN